jgi:CHAD domain-containing protein
MDQRFAVDGVGAHAPLKQAAPAILLAKAEPLFELEAAASGGADMDAVHDMRVASRRLRESMRLLGPLYPPAAFSAWYKRVRRVTRALGPVRDSDVFIDAFSRLNRSLDAGGQRAVAFLVGFRMGQRVRELELLQSALTGLDLAESRRSFAKLVRAPKGGADTHRPLSAFAHAAVAERIAAVYALMPSALVEANMESQHALRITFKRLRYAVEVFAPCYGDEFDSLHDTLTTFQDELGDIHDLHVFLDMVREPDRREAATAAGVSVEDLDAVEALLEKKAHRAFEQFAKMARQHPAGELLPALLLPLSRVAEPEPVDVPTAEGSEAEVVAAPQALAVVGEVEPPPMEIPIADFGGFAIDPPIVVGAEPWAGRPTGVPSVEPDTSQATVVDNAAGALSASTTGGGAPDDAVPEPPRVVPALASGAGGESEELAG